MAKSYLKKTTKELIVRYFELKGFIKDKTARSSKYDTYTKGDKKYYIGKNGAVKTGRTVSDSLSVTARFPKDKVLATLKQIDPDYIE